MNESTLLENMMLMTLVCIARSKPECTGCRWDNPCPMCMSAQIVDTVINSKNGKKRFKAWHKGYKIVAKRRKKAKVV